MTRIKPLIAAVVALGSVAAAPTAATAQSYYGGGYGYQRPYRGYDQRYDARGYDARGYDARGYDYRRYDDRRSYDGRGYYDARGDRRCHNGTTGAIVGALVGGLFGRAVDGSRDHATGTILGAAGGALAGRAVERSNNEGYCR